MFTQFTGIRKLRSPITFICSAAFFSSFLTIPTILSAWQTVPIVGSDVSGKVLDDGGKSVNGAIVRLLGLSGKNITANSTLSGAFTVTKIPIGDYDVCVSVPKSNYVDECHWASKNYLVNLPLASTDRVSPLTKSQSSPVVTGIKSHLSKLGIPKAGNEHGKIEANESGTSGIDDNAVCRLRRQE